MRNFSASRKPETQKPTYTGSIRDASVGLAGRRTNENLIKMDPRNTGSQPYSSKGFGTTKGQGFSQMSHSQVNSGTTSGPKFNMGLRNQDIAPKIMATSSTRPIYSGTSVNQNTSTEGRVSRGGSRTLKAQQELEAQNKLKPSVLTGGVLTRDKNPVPPSQSSFTNHLRVLTEKTNNMNTHGDNGSTHNLLTGSNRMYDRNGDYNGMGSDMKSSQMNSNKYNMSNETFKRNANDLLGNSGMNYQNPVYTYSQVHSTTSTNHTNYHPYPVKKNTNETSMTESRFISNERGTPSSYYNKINGTPENKYDSSKYTYSREEKQYTPNGSTIGGRDYSSYLNSMSTSQPTHTPERNGYSNYEKSTNDTYSRTSSFQVQKTGTSNYDSEERKSERDKITQHKTFNSPVKANNSEPRGLVGLRNIGNTCFMNSILQCLFNAPMFSDYFLNGTYSKEKNSKSKGLAESFADLLSKIRSHKGDPSSNGESTYKFKSALEKINPMFSGYDQHDAQELLKAVLEGINDDLNRVKTKPPYKELKIDPKKNLQQVSDEWFEYMLGRDNSIVTDLFCGQLQSKIICGDCKHESLAFDNFWDLSVSFTRSLNKLDGCELSRMIEHFLKEEVLDDLFYCEKCKKRTKSTKKFVFWRLPKILVIHLKRFHFGKFKREKINQNVIFPVDNLDLTEFIKESSNLVERVYLSQGDSSIKDPRYTLFGIVNHSGSLFGGHYTAEAMNPYNKKWYNFNDDYVRETYITDEKCSTKGSSSPYVLFYVKSSCL